MSGRKLELIAVAVIIEERRRKKQTQEPGERKRNPRSWKGVLIKCFFRVILNRHQRSINQNETVRGVVDSRKGRLGV